MAKLVWLALLVIYFTINQCISESISENYRQKRCIVVQKQSGTHGDSNEGADDEDSEELRNPRPDVKEPAYGKEKDDVQTIPFPPLKYTKPQSNGKYKNYRTSNKNKLHKNKLSMKRNIHG